MTTAERIGLLSGFGWMAGFSLVVSLLLCWMITPGGMFITGWVLESRTLPWRWSQQFHSFFPGDFFLGAGTATILDLCQHLPEENRWYNSWKAHAAYLAIMVIAFAVSTGNEWVGKQYPTRAFFSPTHIYHQVILVIFFGYVALASFVAVVFGIDKQEHLGQLIVACLFFVIWFAMMVSDWLPSARGKAQFAHVANWRPIWSQA